MKYQYPLPQDLVTARTCYKHLAGELGISLKQAFLKKGFISEQPFNNATTTSLTPKGITWSRSKGLTIPAENTIKTCIDNSHKQPHLAGPYGHALLKFLRQAGFITVTFSKRTVLVTKAGQRFFLNDLGLVWEVSR